MITLSVTQLRNLLQLPERPYEDVYYFDGTSYWDLSQREPCTIFGVSGTVSTSAYIFRQNIDYQLTAGSIDWTIPGANKPDFGTPFTVDYTYSRLGSATASTCVANGSMIATMDLGMKFPYGGSTTAGIAYSDLASFVAGWVAAREACISLSTTEIDLAQKSRRGSILLDDSKKTSDWLADADVWDKRYKKYLTMARPQGMVRGLRRISSQPDHLVFGLIGIEVFDNFFSNTDPYYGYGGYGGLI